MKTHLATLVSLLVAFCDAAPACSAEQLTPISVSRVTSVRVSGPPARRYEPLAIGGFFGRDRIREAYAFFPELTSLDSAKGIQPVAKAKTNRVVFQTREKVNGSYDFELHVLEGAGVWTCGGKYFTMKAGWTEFLKREFARQEKDRSEHGYPKLIHVDRDNAASSGFNVKITSIPHDDYKHFSVTLKSELAASVEYAGLTYHRDGELLLGGTAHSTKLEDGQLKCVFNIDPKIANDVGFTIRITRKPRPLVYRFELPSFLGDEAVKTSSQESPKVRLVGKWVGTADEDIMWVANFEGNGVFEMVGTDPARPQRDRLRVLGTYKVDSSVTPTQLKIEALRKHPDGQYIGNVIVEMIDKNRFRISNPSLFSPHAFDKRSFVMQRQDTADVKAAPEAVALPRKPIEITTPRIIELLEKADLAHISTRHNQTILIRMFDGTEYRGRYRQGEAGKYADDEHLFDIYNLVMKITQSRDDLEHFKSISTE